MFYTAGGKAFNLRGLCVILKEANLIKINNLWNKILTHPMQLQSLLPP